MRSTPPSPLQLDLDLLHDLLDVDRDLGPRHLVRAAREVRGVLTTLVLSLAAREGLTLGSGSRDELDRMTRRAGTYREIAERLERVAGARVVKGPSLARHYPSDLLRPVGDLDVVVPDEAALWRAVDEVLSRQECDGALYTEIREGDRKHLFVGLWWAADDPMLDHEPNVEISTFAFPGEHGLVPVRAALPADRVGADVLALAEERFQRPFTVKDMLDLSLVLTGPAAPDPAALAALADEYRLAPELLQLCERTIAAHPVLAACVPGDLVEELRAPAAAEQQRRDALPAVAEEPTELPDRIEAGLPIYGLQLGESLERRAATAAEDLPYPGGLIARTPIADFLMVSGELVDPDHHQRALAELARRGPAAPRS
ncbi:nucleotidyltransferase family protein [Kitasatospora sp. LaBMicrA B282]|uniref:nucleotidyltransferase family protein n=1 Tax=Kitasatospora sp. LaBMicrA B282 TaxID=3420949 RepID=UPI003D123FDE